MNYLEMTVEELEAEAMVLQAQKESVRDKLKALWAIHAEKCAAAHVASLSLPAGYAVVKVDALKAAAKAKDI